MTAGAWTRAAWSAADSADLRRHLEALADPDYRAFQQRLVPEADTMLGVRLPLLRAIAREIARGDWSGFLRETGDAGYEETMLRGMVIGCIRADWSMVWALVEAFVPSIDNWAVCDSFCAGLKLVARHREEVWEQITPYLDAAEPFARRFALVLLMDYFIDEEYIERLLERYVQVRSAHYSVQMAAAWALSMCYVRFPERTLQWMDAVPPQREIERKALQKIVESHRVTPAQKAAIRARRDGR